MLLKRGEPMTVEAQRANVRVAAAALVLVAQEHELVISHGNGPQVGLLALQASAYTEVEAYPLDVLGAETEGMIGYMIEQELGEPAPRRHAAGHPPDDDRGGAGDDPAFDDPTKFVGPQVRGRSGRRAGGREGLDLQAGRRSHATCGGLADPAADLRAPTDQVAARAGHRGHLRGGGGIPTTWVEGQDRVLTGIEAVIDKDFASELLARELDADLFLMATDVDAVYEGWGTPDQRKLAEVTPRSCAGGPLPPAPWVRRSRRRRSSWSTRDGVWPRLAGRHRADRRGNRRHQRGRLGSRVRLRVSGSRVEESG